MHLTPLRSGKPRAKDTRFNYAPSRGGSGRNTVALTASPGGSWPLRFDAFSEAQEKELVVLREESLKLGILQFAHREAGRLAEDTTRAEPLSIIP